MTAGYVRISSVYSSSNTVTFTDFVGDDLPHTYLNQSDLNFSQFGVAYTTGPAKKQRRIWSIAAYANADTVQKVNNLFEDWDDRREDRSGIATVNITDTLLSSMGIGSTITTKAFWTTAPQVQLLTAATKDLFIVSFGLTEVGY